MPQFPFSLRSMPTPRAYRPVVSLHDLLDSLLPYRQPLGLLSGELWREADADQQAGSRRQEPGRVTRPDLFPRPGVRNLVYDRDYDGPPPPPTPLRRNAGGPAAAGQPMETSGDEDNVLPDAVVNSFRESLDREGLDFVKHGPRTPTERLAFAQRVHSGAHMSARLASDTTRNRVRETGGFDSAMHFVGPDGRLYLRDEAADEPLAYRLRRGMEDAVGGFDRPATGRVIEAAFPASESGASSEMLEQLRDGQKWPGESLGMDRGTLPLPPRIPEVKAIEDKFRRVEQDVRDQGLTVGADALKHFMDGNGMPIQYDYSQFRSFPVVQAAEKGVQKHFVDWMLGTHPKRLVSHNKRQMYIGSNLEHIKDDLVRMKDGATLHRGSHWDAKFPYSDVDLGLQATGMKALTPDASLFGATGKAMLRGDGGFTFHRNGDRIEFRGVVEHNFDERFAFERDGRTFYAPAGGFFSRPWEITQEEGMEMQEHGLGKPFQTSARWNQPVSGTLIIDENGGLQLDQIEWGDAMARRRRGGV